MSALASAARRLRITPERADEFLRLLASFDFDISAPPAVVDLPRLHALASRNRLTPYDTAYLDLAMRLGLPLATCDSDLRTAAINEGIRVL